MTFRESAPFFDNNNSDNSENFVPSSQISVTELNPEDILLSPNERRVAYAAGFADVPRGEHDMIETYQDSLLEENVMLINEGVDLAKRALSEPSSQETEELARKIIETVATIQAKENDNIDLSAFLVVLKNFIANLKEKVG